VAIAFLAADVVAEDREVKAKNKTASLAEMRKAPESFRGVSTAYS
jgi:hypothetical protein